MPKCIFVIGLPGCGKTKYIEEFLKTNKNYDVHDGYSEKHACPEQLRYSARVGRNIIVADIGLCFPNIIKEAKRSIKAETKINKLDYDFEYVYFANDPEKCLKNILGRNSYEKDARNIAGISLQYNPPQNCLEIVTSEIWEDQDMISWVHSDSVTEKCTCKRQDCEKATKLLEAHDKVHNLVATFWNCYHCSGLFMTVRFTK